MDAAGVSQTPRLSLLPAGGRPAASIVSVGSDLPFSALLLHGIEGGRGTILPEALAPGQGGLRSREAVLHPVWPEARRLVTGCGLEGLAPRPSRHGARLLGRPAGGRPLADAGGHSGARPSNPLAARLPPQRRSPGFPACAPAGTPVTSSAIIGINSCSIGTNNLKGFPREV